MHYVYPDFPTKKALRDAIAAGRKVTCVDTFVGATNPKLENGTATVAGPHFPQPHKWYGEVTVRDGYVTKVK